MEDSEATNRGLYEWDNLVDRVQASDEELRSGLQALSAVEISVLNDWCLDALNEVEVVNVLQSDGFPCKLAEHCLHVYGDKVGDGCVWRLNERKVCVHFARQIWRGEKRKMESFMDEWMRKIPEGMQASFEMLEGEVLTERHGGSAHGCVCLQCFIPALCPGRALFLCIPLP